MLKKLGRILFRRKDEEPCSITRIDASLDYTRNVKVFSYEDLKLMTHDFSHDNLLGTSDFATLFKGSIPNPDNHHGLQHVTIKRFDDDDAAADSHSNSWRLKNEINFLLDPEVNKLYLPNILGSCWGDCGVFAIVYDLHADCILSKLVFQDRLSWVDRIHILFKVALVLQYLHGLHPCFAFGNLSTYHIILDEAGNPIIYEFGSEFGKGNSHYSSPHYSQGMRCSSSDISSGFQSIASMDIYSFGYILISLLHQDDEEIELMNKMYGVHADENAWNFYITKYGTCFSVERFRFRINPTKFGRCPYFYYYDAHKLSELAIRCISSSVDERPCIDEIVMEFPTLFYMSVHCFASLPINGETVQEMSYLEISNITREFSSFIGDTQFGRLYRGWYRDMEVTVKVFRDEPLLSLRRFLVTNLTDTIHRLKDEILFLRDNRTFNFPCLPKLISFCCEGDNVAVVYNFRTSCSLHTFISDDRFTWTNRIGVMNQCARLVQHMHNYDPHFVLRNISSHHLLLDEDMQMFIVDFGLLTGGFLGVEKVEEYTKYVGALGYADPLYLMTGICDQRVDVYALGVLMVELLGKSHVLNSSNEELETKVCFNLTLFWCNKGPNPTRALVDSVINKDLKIDPYYCDVDASKLVSIAICCVSSPRSGINEIIRELDGLMLVSPTQNMYQAAKRYLKCSNSMPGSSSQS